MKPVRLGMIGCGGIAQSAHLPAILSLPRLVKLVAVSDTNPSAAQIVASRSGADVYEDHRAMVERKDIDVVVITSPEHFHREQVLAAASHGKHILCEKPMSRTLDDADAMIDGCKRTGVKLMIGHSRRFTTRYIEVRRAINRGDIGEVRIVRENERRSRPAPGQPGTYWDPKHWTSDPAISGGAALINGIHETDLLRWFAGSEPATVFAETHITREGNRVPDFFTFTVTFENGAMGQAEVSNCLPAGYPIYHQLEIYGTGGVIRSRDTDQQGLIRFRDLHADFPQTYERLLHFQDAYASELSQFIDAVIKDKPVPLPPEEARAALCLGVAALESARTGRVVHLGKSATACERGAAI